MKTLFGVLLIATAILTDGLCRCPCQGTQRPDRDNVLFACGDDCACPCNHDNQLPTVFDV